MTGRRAAALEQVSRRLVLGVALCITVVLAALPAHAQEDPYGGTTTTRPPGGGNPSCTTDRNTGAPGDTGTATLHHVLVGEHVDIEIGGEVAGSGEAEGPGDESGRTTFDITFVVPQLDPGEYSIAAVGATFTVRCGSGEFDVEVAGADTSRSGPDSSRGGGGFLPRTGAELALWLAIAVLLALVGWAAVRAARRRRAAVSTSA